MPQKPTMNDIYDSKTTDLHCALILINVNSTSGAD